MKLWPVLSMAAVVSCVAASSLRGAQEPAPAVKGADERFKTDLLVVVAHPDDEGGVTPYLARAIYDEHKRVAVVFLTRGGSGGNDYSREHGPALADIREQEARAACAKLGIANAWFLEGKDTASQNVLNSLANWGHGANLEALVRIVRLTRPEVIISWFPGIFIGENHGDHQAAGVLATEAFDLANDPTAFPAQVTGAGKRLEVYLENLTPWQPKKLYYFSDADDQKQFDGAGPAYSVREVSPSQKKPYWRLALEAATPHLTQFPEDIHRMTAMSDEQIVKFMEDPQHMWWAEPMTLIFGKASVQTKATDDVFADLNSSLSPSPAPISPMPPSSRTWLEIGGPWSYYGRFRPLHHLRQPKGPAAPEIAIRAGTSLLIPLTVFHKDSGPTDVEMAVTVPAGWKVKAGEGKFRLPEENRTALLVEVAPPDLSKEELKKIAPQEVLVRGVVTGKAIGEVRLKVQLKTSALAQ